MSQVVMWCRNLIGSFQSCDWWHHSLLITTYCLWFETVQTDSTVETIMILLCTGAGLTHISHSQNVQGRPQWNVIECDSNVIEGDRVMLTCLDSREQTAVSAWQSCTQLWVDDASAWSNSSGTVAHGRQLQTAHGTPGEHVKKWDLYLLHSWRNVYEITVQLVDWTV